MTEVPEHLLARSRARREAAGLATPSEGGATPAPSAGTEVAPAATTAAATPAPAAAPPPPPPPKPDPPYVQAYKNRKKIPVWAMPALAVLPLWAFIYANTLEKPPAATAGPLAEGKQIYDSVAACAGCHGSDGGGGTGPAFKNGAVGQTWPNFKDHIRWVSLGDANWPGNTYGAQNKPKHSGMPSFAGTLTPMQIALVVRYEREVLGGLPPDPDLVAITEGTKPPLDKDGNEVAGG
jgi:mono/diheme cytochrome c family protein